MLEKEKIQMTRTIEYVEQYLYERGISTDIVSNPRYQSILWEISKTIINKRCSAL